MDGTDVSGTLHLEKERRVKCGEEKPHCLRCIKFGIDCGGYLPRKPKGSRVSKVLIAPRTIRFQYEEFPIVPTRIQISTIMRLEPSTSQFTSDSESNYFDIFSSKTAFEILPIFASESFRRIMLQASQANPSIRHALIALGALDKTSQLVSHSSTETEGKVILGRHHENALKQYAIALKLMREQADSKTPDLRIALLHCLVTLCFEAWNGNQRLAMAQIQTGFKLIQAWKEETAASSRLLSSSESNTGLLQIFSRLDVQAISFAEDGWLKKHPYLSGNIRAYLDGMPEEFTTLEEAEQYQRVLQGRIMHLLSSGLSRPKKVRYFPLNGWYGETDPKVLATRNEMLEDCNRWLAAYEPLFKSEAKQKDHKRVVFAKLLRIDVRAIWLGCIIICCGDELEYDKHNEHWADLVENAGDLLKALEPTHKWPPDPKFSFDSYVVIPLYMTGHKCRHRITRRKCISLLLNYSRREGVWDSVFAGKMCQWAMEVEEEFMEDGEIPSWARIHGMSFEPTATASGRQAVLTCQQNISATSDELVTRSKIVTW